jgi:hypothetical protein
LGIASLSMWGAPLSWISGAQDLWMLVFALLALLLDERRLVPWAMGATMLALLSKETAAAIPLVVFAKARFLDGRDWRGGAGRALPYVAIMLAWLFLHPVLLHRLAHPTEQPTTGDHPLALWEIVLRSLLSLVNLDRWDLRVDPDAWRPVATFAAALLLSLAAYAATRFRPVGAAAIAPVRRGVIAFGAAWCVSGWLPLFSPSVGWHAYYGCLGAMGGWLAIAAALERFPMPAAAIVLVLGILRGVAAASPSWDWGSEWYQTRAGNMLRTIRTQLKELHPTLPPHSRLYFGSIPNNIGLVAGRSPAVRIWYGDSTLAAGFYTYYRPRTGSPSQGQDLFFHFDSTVGIREVLPDVPPPAGLEPGSAWERDHESLAMALLTAGDASRAARLFEHIASLPHRPEALLYAGVCWEAAGDPGRAAMSFDSIRARTGASPTEIATLASRLRATMPKVRSPQP